MMMMKQLITGAVLAVCLSRVAYASVERDQRAERLKKEIIDALDSDQDGEAFKILCQDYWYDKGSQGRRDLRYVLNHEFHEDKRVRRLVSDALWGTRFKWDNR